MSFFVYVLESELDKRLYIGMTRDLRTRLQYHNAGRVRSTKCRRPFHLLGRKAYATLKEARRAECDLKRLKDPSRVRAKILT